MSTLNAIICSRKCRVSSPSLTLNFLNLFGGGIGNPEASTSRGITARLHGLEVVGPNEKQQTFFLDGKFGQQYYQLH